MNLVFIFYVLFKRKGKWKEMEKKRLLSFISTFYFLKTPLFFYFYILDNFDHNLSKMKSDFNALFVFLFLLCLLELNSNNKN